MRLLVSTIGTYRLLIEDGKLKSLASGLGFCEDNSELEGDEVRLKVAIPPESSCAALTPRW